MKKEYEILFVRSIYFTSIQWKTQEELITAGKLILVILFIS